MKRREPGLEYEIVQRKTERKLQIVRRLERDSKRHGGRDGGRYGGSEMYLDHGKCHQVILAVLTIRRMPPLVSTSRNPLRTKSNKIT